jgi:hypothetical protein
LHTLENFLVLPHGGAIRRSGTRYVAPRKDLPGDDNIRLVPFIFSENQVFVLEFGDEYVRFFKDGSQVSLGGSPYEIESPFSSSQIYDVDFAQSGNVMYLFHPNVPSKRLVRVSDTNWAFTDIEFYDGPYHEVGIFKDLTNAPGWTLTPSAVGSPGDIITIDVKDSDGVSIIAGGFNENDVGRYIRIYHSVGDPAVITWGVAKITSLNETFPIINAQVIVPFGATTASSVWRMSIFYGPDRWPAKVTFHGERLIWAKNKDYPNSFGGSVIDDFTNFSPSATDGTIADDNAYFYTLSTGQIDEIQWVQSGKVLAIGTVAGPYSVTGSDIRVPITPKAIQAVKESSYGAASVKPLFIDRAFLYASQTRKQVMEMYYAYDVDGYLTPVLSISAEHIFRTKVKEFYPATEPYHVVWGFTDDGDLFSITYMKDQNVVAFCRHPMNGAIKALTVVPTSDYDQLWIAVQRGSQTVIEYLDDLFVPSDFIGKADAYFVDSGLKYSGPPISTIRVAHLPEQELIALADGNVEVVTSDVNGDVTLTTAASKISIGKRYKSKLVTLPIELVTERFFTQGMVKQIKRIMVDIYQSLGGKVGVPDDASEDIEYRVESDPMDSSVPLFSGLLPISFPGSSEFQVQVQVEQDLPLPMHIRALIMEVGPLGE